VFLVNHRHFGGKTAHQAPEPVQLLARLFSRPPSSVLAKMANLDGSRSHGAQWDVIRLPDFLGLEHGGELVLLGQDELDVSVLEAALQEQIARETVDNTWTNRPDWITTVG
jgi:putative restriction endonuclease